MWSPDVSRAFAFLLMAVSTVQNTKAFSPSTVSARRVALHAVAKPQDSYQITLLPGDGIGPEITQATRGVLTAVGEKCGFQMHLTECLMGGAAIDAVQDPFPAATLQQCEQSDSVLLACIGGYQWDQNPRELRPESGLLRMRQSLGLFANLRPAKVLPQLIQASTLKPEVLQNVDIMVVRELTGDVYFGTPKGIDTVDGTLFVMWSTNAAGNVRSVSRMPHTYFLH
jgi:3-isopropylmalate dehydrogenase